MDITSEQWAELFSAFPAPLALVSPDYHFARCNRAYCTMLGYGEPELRQRKWTSITHPDDVEYDQSAAEQIKADCERESYVMDKRYITRAGHVLQVRLFVCAIHENDQFIGYFVAAFPSGDSIVPMPAPAPDTLLSWVRKNPKDAAIVGLATALFLGRDSVMELFKAYLK